MLLNQLFEEKQKCPRTKADSCTCESLRQLSESEDTVVAQTILEHSDKVKGFVAFMQKQGPTVVRGKITGLKPGLHGLHIHEFGDLSNGCESAGAHYNPTDTTHGGLLKGHVGDLENVKADDNGIADFTIVAPRVNLRGEQSVVGRSIIIHEDEDDLGKGGDAESLKTGNAGKRLACGVIVLRNSEIKEGHTMKILDEDVALVKQEILKSINSIDPAANDPDVAKKNEEVLDKIYQILNKGMVLDRMQDVLPVTLKDEYKEDEVMRIAGSIADAPLSYQEKIAFADNLKSNNVIDANLLLTPGQYTIDQLCRNNGANKKVFDHLKTYGIGKQMKGPAEHALAILSSDISIAGKGDVTIGNTPVEVKAAIGEKRGAGGGRFGETGQVPSRQQILNTLANSPMAKVIEDFLATGQKSINIETFTNLANSVEMTPEERRKLSNNLFGQIFGNEGKLVIDEFNKPNANPDAVRKAYIQSNFNWYKASDMGGAWEVLVGISFADNSIGVLRQGSDLNKINTYKKNPAIVTTDKPQEMLYQFNPKL